MISYFLLPTLILSPWWLVQKAKGCDPVKSSNRRYYAWKYLFGSMLTIGLLTAGIHLGSDDATDNSKGQRWLSDIVIAVGAAAYHGKVIRKKK